MTLKCYPKWKWIIALPASQRAVEFPFQVHSHFLATYPHGIPWREKENQRDNKTSPGGSKWAFASGKRKGERWGEWSWELASQRRWCFQKMPSPVWWPLHQTPSSRPGRGSKLREALQTGFRRNQIRGWWEAWGREMSPGRRETEAPLRPQRTQLYKSWGRKCISPSSETMEFDPVRWDALEGNGFLWCQDRKQYSFEESFNFKFKTLKLRSQRHSWCGGKYLITYNSVIHLI